MALNIQNLDPATPENAAERGRLGGLAKKGSKHINTWVQELLHDEEFKTTLNRGDEVKEFKGAPITAIIKAQVTKALDGDTKAYDSLVKSGWVQKTEQDITSNGQTINGTVDPAAAAAYAEYLKGKQMDCQSFTSDVEQVYMNGVHVGTLVKGKWLEPIKRYDKHPDVCMYDFCEQKRVRLTYGCYEHNLCLPSKQLT